MGLLNSAVMRPQSTFGGEFVYRDIFEMAAAPLQSIVNNHALVDGNKQLGWLSTAVFLQINGVRVDHVSNEDAYQFVLWVAATSPSHDKITDRLRAMVA